MKFWFGAAGRACFECCLIFFLIALSKAAGQALYQVHPDPQELLRFAVAESLPLFPLAVLASIFLAFFSVDAGISSRAAGWLGLTLVGLTFMAATLALGLILLPSATVSASASLAHAENHPGSSGLIRENGAQRLWFRALDSSTIHDLVVIDFNHSIPRLAYAPIASFDPARGEFSAGDDSWRVPRDDSALSPLLPATSALGGPWIWQRLNALLRVSFVRSLAAASAFVLFAVGFRFLASLTGWPLANAFLAVAGLMGLVLADAVLSSPGMEALSAPLRGSIPFEYLVAAIEAFLGLALGAADMLGGPKARRLLDE